MPDIDDVERHFRRLHREVVNAYEVELEQHREEDRRWSEWRQKREKQMYEIMHASQIDLTRLDLLEKEGEEALRAYLEEIRPHLITR